MGTSYTYGATKAEIIAKAIKTELVCDLYDDTLKEHRPSGLRRIRTIAHCIRGNIVWHIDVVEQRPDLDTDNYVEINRSIICTLLSLSKGYGWGSKEIPESQGPFYWDCPLSYLDMVPVCGEIAAQWRTKVHSYHENKAAKKFSKYDVLVFSPGLKFESCEKPSVYRQKETAF